MIPITSITGVDLPLPVVILAAPVGAVLAFASSVVPDGWLLCDGRAISREDYSDLFSIIGVQYGSGDGSTTFNLPSLQRILLIGLGDFFSFGTIGGSEQLSLVLPNHKHSVDSHSHTVISHSHTVSTSSHFHSISAHSHTISEHNHTATLSSHSHSGNSHSHGGDSHSHNINSHSHTIGQHRHNLGTHSHTIGNHSHSYSDDAAGVRTVESGSAQPYLFLELAKLQVVLQVL